MSVRLILSQRKKFDQTNRAYGTKCESQRSKNFQAQPVYWFSFSNTEIICHITSYYRFTLHCKITWWLTWGSEHQQQGRAESDFHSKVSPHIRPSCFGTGEIRTSPALLKLKFSSTREQKSKDKLESRKMKCTQSQPKELCSSGCSSVRMEGWDGMDVDGGIGSISPWKRIKGMCECQGKRAHPKFTWQWANTPLGLWFIPTDEGLAGSCRLRMRMKERSVAVGSTAILTTPTWSLEGLGGHLCPPGMQHSQSHAKHPALLSLVCCCGCHFPLLKGGRVLFLFY